MSFVTKLLDAVTVTGAGKGVALPAKKAVETFVKGTGAVSATVNIEGSNDDIYYDVIATFTIAGTGSAHDSTVIDSPYAFTRGNVTAISGTGSAATLETSSE